MDTDVFYSFGIAFAGTFLYLLVARYERNAYLRDWLKLMVLVISSMAILHRLQLFTHYSDNGNTSTHGVPGPLAGVGLPFIAVGYGAYWLVRRYRRKSTTPLA